ncbi:bifunctional folylpolyglutamate synthase/dihydrofolate synthase [Pelotalea chapellei]|uniref:Dihydrofolate synthase/folylpolyglutamate synthase n=1 Tax=Pelotalea chapellei TaxID=44671 RepID=A0ABS5U661_9BACT|nr:folylpolyglutamate synthase/dihydrofolate synthase family protein [Pelotalea chapellei]MBT1071156.1 bifunctional folylpolyglutamate synthase/dihydrofolate synthase [Pelotalea chapellei]
MPLSDMLEKLYARRRFGIRPGVDRIRLLLDRLGNPERTFKSIHVVGTNGKGSTSAFLSSILTAAGHRTALFTSPHLINFNERFRINDHEVDEERLTHMLEKVLSNTPAEATFFEIVTALGAFAFAEQGVEVAVMEAGMGGRSDATAALPGIMTIVTPISLDHCDYLGTTEEKIAEEKAGIIEQGSLAILGHQTPAVLNFLYSHCRHMASRCMFAGKDFSAAWESDGTLTYRGLNVHLPSLTPGISGRYQADNAALALAAAELLETAGVVTGNHALRQGLAAAHWPGRMELVPGNPPLLLDGAHNPAGAAALATSLADYRYNRLLLVIGIMADKDRHSILAPLISLAFTCYCVTPTIERALDGTVLAAELMLDGVTAIGFSSVAEGITAARKEAGPGDLIVVCGSLFTVGEAKSWLQGIQFVGVRG